METVVHLEPLAEPTRSRRRRRRTTAWRALVGVSVVVAFAALCGALATRPDGGPATPRLVPTALPDALRDVATTESLEVVTRPGARTFWRDYGHVGPDGRLDRWIQLTADTDPDEPMPRAPDVVRFGRPIWFGRAPGGEIQGSTDVPGCGRVYVRAHADENRLFDALGRARCTKGAAAVMPFDGMRPLCTHDSDGDRWRLSIRADAVPEAFVEIRVARDNCPVETASGMTFGTESLEVIDGRPTVLWASDSWVASAGTQRRDRHTVHVFVTLPGRSRAEELDAIRLVFAGLRPASPVDRRRWETLAGR